MGNYKGSLNCFGCLRILIGLNRYTYHFLAAQSAFQGRVGRQRLSRQLPDESPVTDATVDAVQVATDFVQRPLIGPSAFSTVPQHTFAFSDR